MDVTTAVTAVENDVTFSTAASSSLTPPTSQAQNMNVNHFHLAVLCAKGAHAFLRLDYTANIPGLLVFWISDLVVHGRLVASSDLGRARIQLL